jgi:hypothetical protein
VPGVHKSLNRTCDKARTPVSLVLGALTQAQEVGYEDESVYYCLCGYFATFWCYMTFGQMKKTFRLIQINGNINPEFSL